MAPGGTTNTTTTTTTTTTAAPGFDSSDQEGGVNTDDPTGNPWNVAGAVLGTLGGLCTCGLLTYAGLVYRRKKGGGKDLDMDSMALLNFLVELGGKVAVSRASGDEKAARESRGEALVVVQELLNRGDLPEDGVSHDVLANQMDAMNIVVDSNGNVVADTSDDGSDEDGGSAAASASGSWSAGSGGFMGQRPSRVNPIDSPMDPEKGLLAPRVTRKAPRLSAGASGSGAADKSADSEAMAAVMAGDGAGNDPDKTSLDHLLNEIDDLY